MVPNNSAARLFIFLNFSLPTRLIWTYTVIKFQIICLPTRLLSTIFYIFSIFSMLFCYFQYNYLYKILFLCIFIVLLSSLKRLKLHWKIAEGNLHSLLSVGNLGVRTTSEYWRSRKQKISMEEFDNY